MTEITLETAISEIFREHFDYMNIGLYLHDYDKEDTIDNIKVDYTLRIHHIKINDKEYYLSYIFFQIRWVSIYDINQNNNKVFQNFTAHDNEDNTDLEYKLIRKYLLAYVNI
jgi:hypothetical protein